MRVLRGSSEPPVSDPGSTESLSFHEMTGLKRTIAPIKIAGIWMGSQDSLNSAEDVPMWERSRHRSASANLKVDDNQMPFGSSGLGPAGFGTKRTRNKRRNSSVSNIIAALESEISNWSNQESLLSRPRSKQDTSVGSIPALSFHDELRLADVMRIDDESSSMENLIEIQPSDVKYHEGSKREDFEHKKEDSEVEPEEDAFVVPKKEYLAFEDLFERLADDEEDNSSMISSIAGDFKSTDAHQEDHESSFNLVEEEKTDTAVALTSNLDTTLDTSAKRLRNRTIDFHDLAPNVWQFNGQVKKYVEKTYFMTSEETESHDKASDDSNSSEGAAEGLGHGLGIILDKLRKIETKLDEIKTYEQNIWYPEIEHDKVSMPNVGDTPTQIQDELGPFMKKEDKSCNTSFKESMTDPGSVVSSMTILVEDQDSNDYIQEIHHNLESLTDDDTDKDSREKAREVFDPFAGIVSDVSSEEDTEDTDEKRKARIEELSKKMILDDKSYLPPISLSYQDGLETVSEESDDQEKADALKMEASSVTTSVIKTSRSRRTRSASRDRSLAKIRYCWRCHQTGHESFDCEAELHPGNW